MIIVPTEKRFDWARAPVVLMGLVLINVLVFFGYQTLDDEKYEHAFSAYFDANYLEHEWPLYQDYLQIKKQESPSEAIQIDEHKEELALLYEEIEPYELSFYLLRDKGFQRYLLNEYSHQLDSAWVRPGAFDKSIWLRERTASHEEINTTSGLAFGLIPQEHSIASFLTHQFLHGDVMHLIGNLFFLIVCGFAVEAAIGHLRFLLFYLACGIGGGFLHMLLNAESTIPLVGASGAISGVMAMYLGVFRLKKIEFFYWFFIFVGYFRAPALFILPFYIGSEVFNYVNDEHSGTAFMAHVGGFVIGIIVILINHLLTPASLNTDYLDEDQDIKPAQLSLANIYSAIEKFQFTLAKSLMDEHIALYGNTVELDLIRFNLSVKDDSKAAARLALSILSQPKIEQRYLHKVHALLSRYPSLTKQFSNEQIAQLASQFVYNQASDEQLGFAEALFKKIVGENSQLDELDKNASIILARKIAKVYRAQDYTQKYSYYSEYAQRALGELK